MGAFSPLERCGRHVHLSPPRPNPRVHTHLKAIFSIIGTTMDWTETDVASEFTFTNPNAKGECGCGESFNM